MPWRARGFVQRLLRRRRSRPQLKRDPLDSTMTFRKLIERLGDKLRGAPVVRSRDEVISTLERELRGDLSDDEWDEFQSLAIADPALDSIRKAVPLEGALLPDGRTTIERCLAELRSRAV